jgi:hypothetical protein
MRRRRRSRRILPRLLLFTVLIGGAAFAFVQIMPPLPKTATQAAPKAQVAAAPQAEISTAKAPILQGRIGDPAETGPPQIGASRPETARPAVIQRQGDDPATPKNDPPVRSFTNPSAASTTTEPAGTGSATSAVGKPSETPSVCPATTGTAPSQNTLRDYRGGQTEINETRENANKIQVGSLDWTIACSRKDDAFVIRASSNLKLPEQEPVRVEMIYLLSPVSLDLQAITVELPASRSGAAQKPVTFTGIELRPSDQKRGFPLRSGVVTDVPGIARFTPDTTNDADRRDTTRLVRNSQWMDLPFRRGGKPFMLTVELPDIQQFLP